MSLARLVTWAISRLAGLVAALPIPGPLRAPLWRQVGARLGASLAEAAQPLSAYPTFQAFFTRKLQAGLQPLAADARSWISPADSLWLSHARADTDIFVPAKNNRHRLSQLLAGLGPSPEQPWSAGTVSTFYLRPKDYHRVHAPCDLMIDAIKRVPGTFWPVNAWGQKVPGIFGVNERLVLRGRHRDRQVFVVFVGALMVGSIAVSHPALTAWTTGSPPAAVAKGDELGMFRFGSTVIVAIDAWIDAGFTTSHEVRMGHEIFRY